MINNLIVMVGRLPAPVTAVKAKSQKNTGLQGGFRVG